VDSPLHEVGQNSVKEEYNRLFKNANVFEKEKIEPLLLSFLENHPDYPPALRLRGLLLQFEISQEISQKRLVPPYDSRLSIMRESYEAALRMDPYFVLALIDLADYWNDLADDPEKAIEYYDRAILLIKTGQLSEDQEVQLRESYRGKIQALTVLGKIDAAMQCRDQAIIDCRGDDYFTELKIGEEGQ
jgi:tetratricopeptide (TPR) repeat protein